MAGATATTEAAATMGRLMAGAKATMETAKSPVWPGISVGRTAIPGQTAIGAARRGLSAMQQEAMRKCKRDRLVHLLCPVGKAFFWGLWKKGDRPKQPVFARGCEKHRRREDAVAQHAVVGERLAAEGVGSAMTSCLATQSTRS